MSVSEAQRRFALEVVRRLRTAEYEALWAGGCVRDALLGKTPKDYDVATNASPDQVREVFGKRRTIPVGAAFGVMTVLGPKEAGQIEVATFRADGDYGDGRRPDSVRFTNAQEDALRRDFTINGLFYDPLAERIIDYVGGQDDLQEKMIRAIGDPEERINEDRLRMLRAVRFAASLGFKIESSTAEAICRHATAIVNVSGERIGAEVKRMLTETNPPRALRLLAETDLVAHVLPPVAANVENAATRLKRLDAPSASLALAATLADVCQPEEVSSVGRTLKWTNKEIDAASWLVENRFALDDAESRRWSELQPVLADPRAGDLVALRRAERGVDASDLFCQERLAWPPEQLDPPPLVVGADLIAAGLRPGPEFSELLQKAREAQLDGQVNDKQQALVVLGINRE